MRSIFVLLILVMIGLNGKGQSVTALPDSVLSQCCLEVTLLNGNVTTVDWVFVQYITRDGTGTKLFVEYAPNFGGIQWETQIRIQDDFDDVLERSKFIVIPFTVGSTDYGINRNWIANIEENTTTGGTWIYGRFGTPAKRKFSAVEDYETMKDLLLACRPRAIVVAENGLYTEGDTVRMGGFLIKNTRIQLEGYPIILIDTVANQSFGIGEGNVSGYFGDTIGYFSRRVGKFRQMITQGNRYNQIIIRDTTSGFGDYAEFSQGLYNSNKPYMFLDVTDSEFDGKFSRISIDFDSVYIENRPYLSSVDAYTRYSVARSGKSAVGVREGEISITGSGVELGAYGYGLGGGASEYLFMRTKGVDNGTASVNQYLQLKNTTTGEVDFATIDFSSYVRYADTAAMLLNYPSTVGYGILKSSKTIRVDTTKLATRFYTNSTFFPLQGGTLTGTGGAGFIGLPSQVTAPGTPASGLNIYTQGSSFNWKGTDGYERLFASTLTGGRTYTLPNVSGTFALGTGTANRVPLWTATNTLGNSNIQDNNTAVSILNSKPFQLGQWTTAGRPTGTANYFGWRDGTTFEWYNGTRWAAGLESTFGRGTATRVPFFDANGQVTDNENFTLNTSSFRLGVGNSLAFVNAEMYMGNTASNAILSSGASFIINLDANNFYSDITSFTIRKNSFGTGGTTLFTVTEAGNAAFGSSLITNAQLTINGSTSAVSLLGKALDLAPTMVANANNDVLVGIEVNPSFSIGAFTGTKRFAARFGQSLAAVNTEISLGNAASNAILSSGASFIINLDATAAYADLTSFNINKNAFGTSGTTIFQVAETGNVTIGGSGSTYILGTSNSGAYGIPRGNTLSRPTWATGTSPLRWNTDTSAIEVGIALGTWVQFATRAYARSLVSGLPTTWLRPALQSGDVTINGAASSDFRIQNTRVQFDGKFKVGSDSSFSHNPATNTTTFKGNITGDSSDVTIIGYGNGFPAFIQQNPVMKNAFSTRTFVSDTQFGTYTNSSGFAFGHATGNDKVGFHWDKVARYDSITSAGWEQQNLYGANFLNASHIFRGGGLVVSGGEFNFLTRATASTASSIRLTNGSINYLVVQTNGAFRLNNRTSGSLFFMVDPVGDSTRLLGKLKLPTLGTGTAVTLLGKTSTNEIVPVEIKRDTTIYVLDADYDFSAALTTAQVASRYNRVIFLMTTTAAAGSDSELTLHRPDINLMQCEYLVRSTDEAGGSSNVIRFGTNNAVDSTNGLASSYFPTAGQGVGIRAGLRSGVYKYFYY